MMEKKPKIEIGKDGTATVAEAYVSGLTERLVEDADKELQAEIYESTVPLRKMLNHMPRDFSVKIDDAFKPCEDGSYNPEILIRSMTQGLFDQMRDGNREIALRNFMYNQKEQTREFQDFKQWKSMMRQAERETQEAEQVKADAEKDDV